MRTDGSEKLVTISRFLNGMGGTERTLTVDYLLQMVFDRDYTLDELKIMLPEIMKVVDHTLKPQPIGACLTCGGPVHYLYPCECRKEPAT